MVENLSSLWVILRNVAVSRTGSTTYIVISPESWRIERLQQITAANQFNVDLLVIRHIFVDFCVEMGQRLDGFGPISVR